MSPLPIPPEFEKSYWVMGAPGAPYGAKILGDAERGMTGARYWVDLCLIGQHIPQMYDKQDVHELTPLDCPRLGLCAECLGFGDVGDFEQIRRSSSLTVAARGIDEMSLDRLCTTCGGTGRPYTRVRILRTHGTTTGEITVLHHAYVPPLPMEDLTQAELFYARNGSLFNASADMCMACSMAEDGRDSRGERIHGVVEEEDGAARTRMGATVTAVNGVIGAGAATATGDPAVPPAV